MFGPDGDCMVLVRLTLRPAPLATTALLLVVRGFLAMRGGSQNRSGLLPCASSPKWFVEATPGPRSDLPPPVSARDRRSMEVLYETPDGTLIRR